MHRPRAPHLLRGRRARARGLSLIEVVLVIALIAGITAITAGAFGVGMKGAQLREASRTVATQLRFTRTQAIATGVPQRFTLDLAGHSWAAPGGRTGEIPQAIGIKFTGARQAMVKRDEGAVMFFEDGASTGGRVQLSRGGQVWNVDVAWLTGTVKVSRELAP